MAETVKVPAIGPVKKSYVYVAGAAVVGFVGYAWWTRGGGFAPVEEPTVPVDEFGDERITPNTIDTFDVAVDNRTGITTTAEWSQFVISHLTGTGYESTVVSTAVGRFLARQPLNAVDIEIARQAWAVGGEPPEGRPWTIIPVGTGPAAVGLAAPANFRAEGGTNKATLSWAAVQGADRYETRLRGFAWKNVGNTTSEIVPFPAQRAPTSYTFEVRAINTANQAGPESSASAVVQPAGGSAPGGGGGTIAAPSNVRATEITRTSVLISWTAVPGAQKYYVSRDGGPGSMKTTTRSRATGLRPGSRHTWTVRAAKGRRPNEIVSAPVTVSATTRR